MQNEVGRKSRSESVGFMKKAVLPIAVVNGYWAYLSAIGRQLIDACLLNKRNSCIVAVFFQQLYIEGGVNIHLEAFLITFFQGFFFAFAALIDLFQRTNIRLGNVLILSQSVVA